MESSSDVVLLELINESSNQIINSEKISKSDMDKLAINEENEQNQDQTSPPLIQDENSKDDELVGYSNLTEIYSHGDKLEDKITRPCQFALSRIKTIMKYDPDLALSSKESVFAIAKATVSQYFQILIIVITRGFFVCGALL